MIDNLPLFATDEYLCGMISMVSQDLLSHRVETEDSEVNTGYMTFSSRAEAERIIEALNGIPNGAKKGMLLKVEWAFNQPVGKKPRSSASPLPVDDEDSDSPSELSLAPLPGGPKKTPPSLTLLDGYSYRTSNFELKVKLSGLQNVVHRTRDPDSRRPSYETSHPNGNLSPEASLKEFLIGEFVGPEGANLHRLCQEGVRVGVWGCPCKGILDPEMHILITADNYARLISVAQLVEAHLSTIADILLFRFLQVHGSAKLLAALPNTWPPSP
jgi:hypothetical protein